MTLQAAGAEKSLELPQHGVGYVSDLDTPLLMFSEEDVWTLRHAAEGVLITGGVGSGKSSSSGALIAKSYLRAGFGGIVCCANVDEVDRWRRYAEETGRSQSLIVLDKSLEHRFNFLDYQMAVGRGSTFEAVRTLLDILTAAEGRHDVGEGGKDQFWQQSVRQLLGNTLAPLWAAHGRITLAEVMRFIHSRPLTKDQLDPEGPWFEDSFWAQTMDHAEERGAFPIEKEDFDPVWDYWTSESEMMAKDQRTAANIIKTVTGRLDPFLKGDLRRLFCTHSTFVPELTFEGAVIVLDLSAHGWGEEGVLGQHIVKLMWQKAMQNRSVTPESRPCFCFADECQYFLSPTDQIFTSTSRARLALNVYMTQNIPTLYAKIGGQNAQNIVDALAGNLASKFFHAQPDARTSEWASTMIGKAVTWRRNKGENESEQIGISTSTGSSGGAGPSSHQASTSRNSGRGKGRSQGASETIDYRLQPSHFTTLRKGGGADRISEAVIFQAGRIFASTRSTWAPVLFRQT